MTSSLGRSRYPLRDLVLLTVVAAMLFAAIRPVLDGIGQVLHMDAFLMTPLVVALGLGCAALVSAMHPRQWWFYAGAVFTMAGLVWVAADPMLEFASGGYRSRNVDPLRLHAALVCGVALFTGLIPYRLRGWTLARRSRRHA